MRVCVDHPVTARWMCPSDASLLPHVRSKTAELRRAAGSLLRWQTSIERMDGGDVEHGPAPHLTPSKTSNGKQYLVQGTWKLLKLFQALLAPDQGQTGVSRYGMDDFGTKILAKVMSLPVKTRSLIVRSGPAWVTLIGSISSGPASAGIPGKEPRRTIRRTLA